MNARRQLYDDPRRNERDLPHIVELPVPEGGFRDQLAAMHDWHRKRFLQSRSGHGGCRDGVWYVRYCFKEPRDAADFKAAFGGQMVAPPRSRRA